MRVLVTGGAGRLGSSVCSALADGGFDALAVDRTYNCDLPVPLEVADLLDPVGVYRLLEGCDAVVHLANHPHARVGLPPQRLYAENVTMDANVFQAAAEVGVRRLVFASSVQVFAGTRTQEEDGESEPSCLPYLPLDGELPPCPGNSYALSKEAGEAQMRYYARLDEEMSCTAIRFPLIMTERYRQWYRRHGRAFRRRAFGNLDEGFAYLTDADAASLVLAVLQRQGPGYHQLFPAAPDTYVDMPIPEIIERYYPQVPPRVPADEMESLVDISAIRASLGWEPRETGIFGQE